MLNWFNILFSLSGCRSSTGDVSKFHPGPRPSDHVAGPAGDNVSGLTHGNDFVVTGPTARLIELNQQVGRSVPKQNKDHQPWSNRKQQSSEQKNTTGAPNGWCTSTIQDTWMYWSKKSDLKARTQLSSKRCSEWKLGTMATRTKT